MANKNKRLRNDPMVSERVKKIRIVLLTILIGVLTAAFIAVMILWAYQSDRFRK